MAENSLTDKLCNAAASGNLPDVLFWLQNGADVNGLNKYKRTALQVVMLGSTSVVEALLAAGARPDVRDPVLGLTVTHDAARGGFAHTVRALLQHGANVDLVDDRGNLPLHLAATAGHLDQTTRVYKPRIKRLFLYWLLGGEGKLFWLLSVKQNEYNARLNLHFHPLLMAMQLDGSRSAPP
uniref:Uncharacterized protein n=1 Tax=Scophthalmus maximus TaxID=52904 RepID=A0A8D3A162_SCOMX